MRGKGSFFISAIMLLLFTGCGGEQISDAGSHFQNRDCLECHNRDLSSEAALTYGGTVYLDAASDADDLSKMCNQQVFLQLISGIDGVTLLHDGRSWVSGEDSGALGRGNLFLPKKTGSIPDGSFYIRLLLSDGTPLAQSLLHDFNSGFDTNNTADLNNRYSCNACHSIAPSFASGLIVAKENISFCLDSPSDVSAATFFAADTFPLLDNKCGSCHTIGFDGATYSFFDLDSTNISQTRTDLLFAFKNPVPANSGLVNCPADSNHTGLEICSQNGTSYNRIIDWLTLEN